MEQNFEAFDQLRAAGYLVGEMIWNFADFATPQGSSFCLFHQSWFIPRFLPVGANCRFCLFFFLSDLTSHLPDARQVSIGSSSTERDCSRANVNPKRRPDCSNDVTPKMSETQNLAASIFGIQWLCFHWSSNLFIHSDEFVFASQNISDLRVAWRASSPGNDNRKPLRIGSDVGTANLLKTFSKSTFFFKLQWL